MHHRNQHESKYNQDNEEEEEEEDWLPTMELPLFLTCSEDEKEEQNTKANDHDDDISNDEKEIEKNKENKQQNPNTKSTSFHNDWTGMLPTSSKKLIPIGCNLHGIDLDDEDSLIRCLNLKLQ